MPSVYCIRDDLRVDDGHFLERSAASEAWRLREKNRKVLAEEKSK